MQIIRIPGFNPGPMTGAGNNTYLLPGRTPTLLDAATGEAAHLSAVEEALGSDRLAQVLVTHAHQDHADGSEPLAARWPDGRLPEAALAGTRPRARRGMDVHRGR